MQVDLSSYRHTYRPGRPALFCALWFFAGLPLLRCALIPSSKFRVWLLRLFGARLGAGLVIKPGVRVKYPWLLHTGDHCWIGEDCWIDNLAPVRLGSSVCVSQGAYFCTGNHDWTDPAFGLMVGSISVGDGAWIGARALIAPGTVVGEGAVVAAGAVATKRIPPYAVYAGNPAGLVGIRELRSDRHSDSDAHVAIQQVSS
jgi:putative colanic acid biosynthesis acetyltransferase WcaF